MLAFLHVNTTPFPNPRLPTLLFGAPAAAAALRARASPPFGYVCRRHRTNVFSWTHQMLTASFIITVLSASMLKIAHMREKWERKLQVSTASLSSTSSVNAKA